MALPFSYSQAASNHRYKVEYTAAVEASLRINVARKTAVLTSSGASSFANVNLPVDLSVDLTNEIDLEAGPHNEATIRFIFGSEHCQMNGNEAVRLAQLSPTFCSKFIRPGNKGGMSVIQQVNLVADKFITGSAFVAMKDIVLYKQYCPSQVYSDLFNESYATWLSAILYVNEILGPFPHVSAFVNQKLDDIGMTTLVISPMAHEFQMVPPHINIDPHIRNHQFDCFQRYVFTEVLIKTKWETKNMTYFDIADMVRRGWSYVGSSVECSNGNGEHTYVFRRPM